jgi:choline kinase
MTTPDTVVILAAGFGSRLDAPEGHKILAEIGGKPLLDWHLGNFVRAGVRDFIIVTGYEHEELQSILDEWPRPDGVTLRTAFNPRFELSNGISILAADAPAPFWLVMSDHLIEPRLFDRLPDWAAECEESGVGGSLAIDYDLDAIYDMPDANKLRRVDGRLDAIGKELDDFDCVDVGLFWCGSGFVEALRAEKAERGDCNTSDAMRRLDRQGKARFWDVGDAWWQDVDTPGARAHAETLVDRTE